MLLFQTDRRVILLNLLITLAGFSPLFAQNILQNGGFENETAGWSLINGSPGTEVVIDNTIFYQGNSSAKLVINDPANMIVAGLIQTPGILPLTTYEFSYAIKTSNVDFIAYPYLKFNDGTDYYITSGYASGRTKDWTTYTMRLTTPAQVNNLELYFFLYGHTGTAWVDAVQLTALAPAGALHFNVNTATIIDTFNHKLLSTNSSPIRPGSPNDLTAGFQEIGIDEVRTHDIYNACDIHVIFPDMNADPLDPAAYHFAASDLAITSIINCGSTPFFRLGESFSATSSFNTPPADFDKWAKVCLQIVKHYNEGWNNGFNYHIKKWEIWNEPDLYEFWAGTPQQFYDLYATTATTLKNYDSTLTVGMAGFAVPSSTWFIEPLCSLITANNTPLDFVSYHGYSNSNPYFFKLREQELREVLSAYGLDQVKTCLTEWNNYSYSSENTIDNYGRDDALSAALTASSVYYLQQSTVHAAHRYRSDEYYFGLFRDDGTYSYSGMAFKALGHFNSTGKILSTTGSDSLGVICMAGKSPDNTSFSVLISNPSHTTTGYTLQMDALMSGYDYQITRMDATHPYTVVATGIVSPASSTIIIDAVPPFVDLITFRQVVGTRELPAEEVAIFPNPTTGMVHITATLPGIQTVEITNALGQTLLSPVTVNGPSCTLTIPGKTPGICFVKVVTTGNKWVIRKIVVE